MGDLNKMSLDADDLNGPGLGNFPRETGVLSTDFALFTMRQYSKSKFHLKD